jgi:hypothetical protein
LHGSKSNLFTTETRRHGENLKLQMPTTQSFAKAKALVLSVSL